MCTGQLTWLRPADITFPDSRQAVFGPSGIGLDALLSGLLGVSPRGMLGGGSGAAGAGGRRGWVVIDDAPSADDIRQQACTSV